MSKIEEVHEGYNERIDKVIENLRPCPTRKGEKYVIVHVSKDFLCVQEAVNLSEDGAITAGIQETFRVSREMIREKDPSVTEDTSLLEMFVGAALSVPTNPFCVIAYDKETHDYVKTHAQLFEEKPFVTRLKTDKSVPFELAFGSSLTWQIPTDWTYGLYK